jgi:hypothetical protein
MLLRAVRLSNGKWAFSNSLRILFKIIAHHKQAFFNISEAPRPLGGTPPSSVGILALTLFCKLDDINKRHKAKNAYLIHR